MTECVRPATGKWCWNSETIYPKPGTKNPKPQNRCICTMNRSIGEAVMKSHLLKIFVLSFALILCSAQAVSALSVGAPVRTLETGGFSLSGTIGYMDLDIDDVNVTSKSFFFKGAFAGGDGVTPYLKLGFADLEAGSVEGSLDFSYGGGVLLDFIGQQGGAGFKVSMDAQLVWIESSEGSSSLDLFEGQLSILGSTRSGGTNAYAGLAASFLNFDGEGTDGNENGKSHLFFGIDYFMDYNFYFNAEAHLFGEDSLSVGVGYLF